MRPLELPDLLYQASGQHQQRTAVSRAPLYVVPTTMPCLLKRIVHMPCLLDAYWMPNTRLPHAAYFAVQGCSDYYLYCIPPVLRGQVELTWTSVLYT
jgi:hypothetical protein